MASELTDEGPGRRRGVGRAISASITVAGLVLAGVVVGLAVGSAALPTPVAVASPTVSPSATPEASATPGATATPTARPTPEPTPEPTPVLVPAPLTGRLITEAQAAQHPIAVMIDDHRDAWPQSGFNAASVVWQAPAEGGIPRYMLIFGETVPTAVGPVRSARQYYIEWAAEWRALFVHSGGSPGALQTLRVSGGGQLVWNADEFRWGGRYLWRSADRRAPHNVYTDGEHLRALGTIVGATDAPLQSAWSFGPPADGDQRPVGAQIKVVYPYETITYRYDAASNTWPRFIDASPEPQRDPADGAIVAPTNVIVLRLRFGPLDDGSGKDRLEAAAIGGGDAWIASDGRLMHGTWRKDSATSPTLVFGPDGLPAVLTNGQTYVQVIALGYEYALTAGQLPTVAVSRGRPAPR